MSVRNSYLVCRMFWCDESVHSAVCWGSSEPQFKFQQVSHNVYSNVLVAEVMSQLMVETFTIFV